MGNSSLEPEFKLYAINSADKFYIFHISSKRNGTWYNLEYDLKEVFSSTITIRCVNRSIASEKCNSTLTLRFNENVAQYVRISKQSGERKYYRFDDSGRDEFMHVGNWQVKQTGN